MNVLFLENAENGAVESPVGNWAIQSPATGVPRTIFRRTFILRFGLGTIADRVQLETDASSLEAVFEPFDYDALNIDLPSLKATLAASGGTLVVTLDAPREVRRIRLSSGKGISGAQTVELYRLDGDVPAGKPTVTASVENDTATFQGSFTDVRFAIRIITPGALGPPQTNDVAELHVRSYPTTPRLGIPTPKPPPEALFFWQTAGDVGKGTPAERGVVNAGESLAAELQRYLDAHFDSLREKAEQDKANVVPPQWVDVALFVESDAPCNVNITNLVAPYHLVLESFSSGAKKEVLRFSGGAAVSHEVPFSLPLNALVQSATVGVDESLRNDAFLPTGPNGNSFPDPWTRKEGISLEARRWAGLKETPVEATLTTGIALALMATQKKTEILFQLREDWSGQAAGRVLVREVIKIEPAGRPHWMRIFFPNGLVLPASPVWVLLKAARGHGVWLADSGAETVHLFEDEGDERTSSESSTINGLHPLRAFFTRPVREHAVGIQSALRLGGVEIITPPSQTGAKDHDFTVALQQFLSRQPPSPQLSNIPLTFTTVAPGLITVYSPRIVFDL